VQGVQENNIMNEQQMNNDTRTSGTDISNLGDNTTMIVRTTDGKEIKLHLYGR
jgi:phage terminase large subunit-like protein